MLVKVNFNMTGMACTGCPAQKVQEEALSCFVFNVRKLQKAQDVP